MSQTVVIESIQGNKITLKEKLLHDIHPAWNVSLSSASYLKHVGIEHLKLEFPKTKYSGHHLEAGFNGIYLKNLYNSWVDDINIAHGDNGILIEKSKNITLQNIKITGRTNHHSIAIASSNDILVN